ncbi:KNOTEN1 [Hibiscus trionum]|uniref:KNOTEN1 n=1 Tax=Hibiscus trionum TaxID=183268 RepID=A0A9W7HAZ2_HIBTR|nr:KNOTEN1 [Hibiscus trionum]
MANFEAPSISLGLDLDLDADSDPRSPDDDHPGPILAPSPSASFNTLEDNAEELESQQVMDSDPDDRPDPPRVLKRLRRAVDKYSATKKESEKTVPSNNGDDEIEEFSSQETNDVNSSTKYHSVCSSSKVPLKRLGLLTTQSSSQSSTRKKEEELVAPASGNLKARHDGLTFPKLTISPLRRFQLLDSDSDDRSDHEDTGKGAHKIDPLPKEQRSVASDEKRKTSFSTPQNDDLWNDFSLKNSSRIQTPAFDEICKEYFQSLNDKNASQKLGNDKRASQKIESQKVEQQQDLDDPLPPAHRYFFHADPRIQRLVRSRLPFFTPLSMVNNGQHQQPNVSVMDFMSQFSKGESSKQRGAQKASGKDGSTSRRNKSKKPNAENGSFEGWVNTESSGAIPKNAGKRRVHASGGQSTGHWYTSPEGRKVYVTGTGQELSGQMAYRHYRKESGAGFRKLKKKRNAKKKKG